MKVRFLKSLFFTQSWQPLTIKIILLPDGALADTSITNVTNEDNRRVELKVGISYQSDIRKAKSGDYLAH